MNVTGLVVRVLDVPKEVRLHNDQVLNRDQDLATWITDTDKKLDIALQGTQNRMAADGQLYSGALPRQLDHERGQVREACRNEHRAAMRLRRELLLSERLPHRVVRRLTVNPLPEITAHERHADVLRKWDPGAPGQSSEAA
jgi:hypothetical protein